MKNSNPTMWLGLMHQTNYKDRAMNYMFNSFAIIIFWIVAISIKHLFMKDSNLEENISKETLEVVFLIRQIVFWGLFSTIMYYQIVSIRHFYKFSKIVKQDVKLWYEYKTMKKRLFCAICIITVLSVGLLLISI